MISDSLLDEHILELSKRITDGNELMEFGVIVLKLPDFKIKSALYDHNNSIQEVTHELLSTWMKGQTSRQEAYTNLYSDLRKGEMKQLAGLLKQWVEGVREESKQYSIVFVRIAQLLHLNLIQRRFSPSLNKMKIVDCLYF